MNRFSLVLISLHTFEIKHSKINKQGPQIIYHVILFTIQYIESSKIA